MVDDDPSFLKVVSYQVRAMGFDVVTDESAGHALERFSETKPDLVVTDLRMPGIDGLGFMDALKERDSRVPVIVLTAHGTIEKAVEATRRGAFEFLTKPFEKQELEQAINSALRLSSLTQENERLNAALKEKFAFEGIIGSSRSFREVLKMARQLAEVETTVLIQGESGTGKELVARAIHFNSDRKSKPLVTVNCGAIPKELVESELFGHRKGAFTGANSDRKGKFEAADSGTIFLDEIGDLPMNMQVKLLRVLQQKEIDVVGDPRPRPVDVRVIAATNRDLYEMVQQKEFRDDLYYRLSVAPLRIPSLRERREDIPMLVHHFAAKYQERLNKQVEFDPEAIELLQIHDWPGNIRELENIVERLVVFAKGERVRKSDLPSHLSQHAVQTFGDVIIHLPQSGFSLEDLERDLLRAALEMNDWNQTQAARYLGLSRSTLIYRMQKYGLGQEKESGR